MNIWFLKWTKIIWTVGRTPRVKMTRQVSPVSLLSGHCLKIGCLMMLIIHFLEVFVVRWLENWVMELTEHDLESCFCRRISEKVHLPKYGIYNMPLLSQPDPQPSNWKALAVVSSLCYYLRWPDQSFCLSKQLWHLWFPAVIKELDWPPTPTSLRPCQRERCHLAIWQEAICVCQLCHKYVHDRGSI